MDLPISPLTPHPSPQKYALDLTVVTVTQVHERYVLIHLTDSQPLPPMLPGQFVEVRVDGSASTFLRRPISINFVDDEQNELWLLVATVGAGTRRLAQLHSGDRLNCVLPLGHGFTMPAAGARVLLVGGGVGVAPLLFQGAALQQQGIEPTFLLGARSESDLLMLDAFRGYGRVFTTTEDGTAGQQGFVTNHTLLNQESFDLIQTCGPTPMMKAVATYARQRGIECEVSLENLMACGLGACLCCVEKTTEGNVCVCKDGPVFNINRLLW